MFTLFILASGNHHRYKYRNTLRSAYSNKQGALKVAENTNVTQWKNPTWNGEWLSLERLVIELEMIHYMIITIVPRFNYNDK